MQAINSKKIQQNFEAAHAHYHHNAIAQHQISQTLRHILLTHSNCHTWKNGLEIGCGSGSLTAQLNQYCSIQHWDIIDLCDCRIFLNEILPRQSFQFFQMNAEQYETSKHYDLIASSSAVQWFHQPQQWLQRCAKQLSTQGLLLFSTFSEENLLEIKTLTGIGLDYPSLETWQTWLSPDFDILHLSQEQIVLEFATPQAVLAHLKSTGVRATNSQIWTKTRLQKLIHNYQYHYATSQGGVRLTYAPIYCLARKK